MIKELIVLIIDDDSVDRTMFRRFLKETIPKVTVLEADSTDQGLELYYSDKPDCVILDYKLPVSNGFSVLKELLSNHEDMIPVIIVTGQGNESLAVEAMKIGAQDYLVKGNITSANLYRAVINALDKVRLKQTIEEQHQKMLRAKQELEQIAHVAFYDLQEPLKNISALCDRLETKCSNLPEHDDISKINIEIAGMHELLSNLSKLSRMESIRRTFSPVDLSGVAKLAISNLQSYITKFNGDIKTANLPVIEADATQIYQLFHNLLSFEILLHNKKEPFVLKIDGGVIENQNQKPRKSSPNTKLCQITLENESSRMAQKNLENLFNPSYLFREKDGYHRSGIGLVLCRRIVERHEGKIFAKNIRNKRTKFTIQLPVKQPKTEGHKGIFL